MAVSSEWRSIAIGNPVITDLNFTDMTVGAENTSDEGGAQLIVIGAASVLSMEFGLRAVGAFASGDALTFNDFSHKVSPSTGFTPFTGLSTGIGDVDNVSMFASGTPATGLPVDIGITPPNNAQGNMDGNGFMDGFFTFT